MNTRRYSAEEANSRMHAAKLLRAARRAVQLDSAEALHWFTGIMPDRPSAQRLEIDWLMESGDEQAAEAAIARALLRNPHNALLLYRRARIHLAQGRLQRAKLEITRVIEQRPCHYGAHVLAGRIERALGNFSAACRHLEHTRRLRPHCEAVLNELVELYMLVGRLANAEALLRTFTNQSPLLEARVLIARHQLLDACDHLRRSIPVAESCQQQDELLALLIEQLEKAGAYEELRQWIDQLEPDRPQALTAAAAAQLRLGDPRSAMALAMQVIRQHRLDRPALHVLVVAAALGGRRRLADQALARLETTNDGVDAQMMAELWQRGIAGQAIFQPHSLEHQAEGTGRGRILPTLLQQATETLQAELRSPQGGGLLSLSRIQRYLALCETAQRAAA